MVWWGQWTWADGKGDVQYSDTGRKNDNSLNYSGVVTPWHKPTEISNMELDRQDPVDDDFHIDTEQDQVCTHNF